MNRNDNTMFAFALLVGTLLLPRRAYIAAVGNLDSIPEFVLERLQKLAEKYPYPHTFDAVSGGSKIARDYESIYKGQKKVAWKDLLKAAQTVWEKKWKSPDHLAILEMKEKRMNERLAMPRQAWEMYLREGGSYGLLKAINLRLRKYGAKMDGASKTTSSVYSRLTVNGKNKRISVRDHEVVALRSESDYIVKFAFRITDQGEWGGLVETPIAMRQVDSFGWPKLKEQILTDVVAAVEADAAYQ